jgi:serine/threonine protein kinase
MTSFRQPSIDSEGTDSTDSWGILTNVFTGNTIACGLNDKKTSFVVGSNGDYKLEGASSKHFMICYEDSRLYLVDFASDGTMVNELKVVKGEKLELSDGDIISLFQTSRAQKSHVYFFTSGQCDSDYEMSRKTYGAGGFGSVYLGLDQKKREIVAIKSISLSNTEHLSDFWGSSHIGVMKEIEILSKAAHPNILSYRDSYKDGFYMNIVTEFIGGGTLQDWAETSPSPGSIKHVVLGIVKGLDYLHHQLKIAHRDIRPQNILISVDGLTAKISDFGLSRSIDDESDCPVTRVAHRQFGAPEIFQKCDGMILTALDIWGLGATLYHLFTEDYPDFRTEKNQVTLSKWKDISDIDLRYLILQMIRVDPHERISIRQVIAHKWFHIEEPVYHENGRVAERSECSEPDELNENMEVKQGSIADNPDEFNDDKENRYCFDRKRAFEELDESGQSKPDTEKDRRSVPRERQIRIRTSLSSFRN